MEIVLKNFKTHPSRPSLNFDVEIPLDGKNVIELRGFTYFKRGQTVDSPKARIPGLKQRIVEVPRIWLDKMAYIIPVEATKNAVGPVRIVIPIDRLQDQPIVAEAASQGNDLRKLFGKR